jgi:hypothetical protein
MPVPRAATPPFLTVKASAMIAPIKAPDWNWSGKRDEMSFPLNDLAFFHTYDNPEEGECATLVLFHRKRHHKCALKSQRI